MFPSRYSSSGESFERSTAAVSAAVIVTMQRNSSLMVWFMPIIRFYFHNGGMKKLRDLCFYHDTRIIQRVNAPCERDELCVKNMCCFFCTYRIFYLPELPVNITKLRFQCKQFIFY